MKLPGKEKDFGKLTRPIAVQGQNINLGFVDENKDLLVASLYKFNTPSIL